MINKIDILNINKRYSDRFKINGYSPKTLGWSDKGQQNKRFERFASNFESNSKKILDIGCGFGDFYNFLKENSNNNFQYTGIDINPDLIKTAQEHSRGSAEFLKMNILKKSSSEFFMKNEFQIVLAMGVFNLNFANNKKDMEDFLEEMVNKMISISSEMILFDFLPLFRMDKYKAENYIMTYSFDLIAKIMSQSGLLYTIKCDQIANPMAEALVIARKW